MTRRHFAYKLIPPRRTFFQDMSDQERAIMGRHVLYWTGQLEVGKAVVFGPVLDPAGSWGLAIVEADNEEEVHAMALDDPAVTSKMASFEVYPMPRAIVRSAAQT